MYLTFMIFGFLILKRRRYFEGCGVLAQFRTLISLIGCSNKRSSSSSLTLQSHTNLDPLRRLEMDPDDAASPMQLDKSPNSAELPPKSREEGEVSSDDNDVRFRFLPRFRFFVLFWSLLLAFLIVIVCRFVEI